MSLSKAEQQQYNRHLILDEIGELGQLKLKKAKVLVIGAGGLGCPILQYLSAAGVGTIGVVDDDKIEQSNLQRQVLYSHDDIGDFKAEVAANKLAGLNPYVNFDIHLQCLNKEIAIELFLKYDIIVDGSDNFPTRYLVNDAAILTNKPVVFGSIFKFEGQVSVFNYNNGPSYRCLYPNPPKSEDVPNCSEIGVLGVLPGIIGSLQANEVLKLVLGIGEVLSGKLLTYNALNMQQLILRFKKNEAIKITHLENNYQLFCGLTKMSLEITKCELENNLSSYNLLDVREVYERDQYHIGGIHIPLGELNKRKSELPVDKDLIVYCKAGIRSKIAIKKLQEYFPKKLLNLKNGLIDF